MIAAIQQKTVKRADMTGTITLSKKNDKNKLLRFLRFQITECIANFAFWNEMYNKNFNF